MKRTSHFSMKRAACALALATAALPGGAALAAPSASAVEARSGGVILLGVGQSKVVDLPARMSDVIIAQPEVVDVHVRSQNQLYLLAKKPGESSVSITTKDGRVLWSATVRVGNNLTSIDQMLRLAMPDADITVSNLNGLTLLTGTVKAPEDAAEAERLVQAFVGKEVTVVSRLRTATPLQVNLQVRIAEVSRNLLHQVGTNLTGLGRGIGDFTGYVGRSSRSFGNFGAYSPGTGITRPFTFTQPTGNLTTLGFVANMFGMDVAGALDLAETTGLATMLAQPNLTALSGETASFLAGGEYPYQVYNGSDNGNSIQFKQYGVQLAFTPTVMADGRVSLRVRPQVSSLDFSINASVPALKSRSAETTVELGSGQAFMIAGLLSNETANNIDKVPGIGNVPILGSLFKSRKFQRNETELVIVVVPYLVQPVNAADIRLPTDAFRSATDLQGLILQQGSDGKTGGREFAPSIAPGKAPADPAATAPGPQAAAPPATERKSGKSQRTASADKAPTPGFSF